MEKQNKAKKDISSIYLNIKETFEKFPITNVFIIIATVAATIIFTLNDDDFFLNVVPFSSLCAVGILLVETVTKDKLSSRIVYYIIIAFISGIFTRGIMEGKTNYIIIKYVNCYCISLLLLSVYFNYKKSSKKFGEYIFSVYKNYIKISLIYVILAIGLAVLGYAFIYLILDSSDIGLKLVLVTQILLFGLYYIPNIIYAISHYDEEEAKFEKSLIEYVIEPLVIVAFVLIYIYIIKILTGGNVPKNQIFGMLAFLFMIGCPVWTMVSTFKEESNIKKINKYLPLAFIPFIFLQIYVLWMRVANNGFTQIRYYGMILVILETIYTIMYIVKKELSGKILLVLVGATIITTIIPGINAEDFSNWSQINNVKIIRKSGNITDEEKEKIIGAYNYLMSKSRWRKTNKQNIK